EDGIRDRNVTGVQTCALPICLCTAESGRRTGRSYGSRKTCLPSNERGYKMKDYIVSTKSGKVRGYERNGVLEYLGIPFAQPPKEIGRASCRERGWSADGSGTV